MNDTTDILTWIQQAKKGNQKAFNFLLNTFWREVYYYQLNKCKDEDEAEDITIKTFARAFDKIDSFDEDYTFKTWLFTISNNIFIDHLRKKKTETISINKNVHEIHKIADEEPSPANKI